MDSQKRKLLGILAVLPLALLFVSASAAQDAGTDGKSDQGNTPDLVITEDSQIALLGRSGKAVIGSCKTEDPLWKGKIALKNIGSAPITVDAKPVERLAPTTSPRDEELPPHVRIYVPNNIELQSENRLSHTLEEFGQELLEIKIGEGENKCRNYGAPPVFDERLSGLRGPHVWGDGPDGSYGWRIKKIQRALIDQGYPLPSGPDGDYGPETTKAIVAYFKDRGQSPPAGIYIKPLPPETVDFLLENLVTEAGGATASHAGANECIRGVNQVPMYIEIDPERDIPGENRSNNRVQFTVEIDCSNVAR